MEKGKPLRVYNTLSGEKEEFIPLEPGRAGMYVCGVTVYDECHLGHARAYVSFDIIKRFLRHRGFEVRHVQNFTDIDDKIINRAASFAEEERKKGREVSIEEACREISEKYTADYFTQMDRLNVARADVYPRAAEHVEDMVEVIGKLIGMGRAYSTGSGVYFSVEGFEDYGKLSRRDISGMQAGARVEPGKDKRHPMDFALWKSSREGEPSWESPFGRGRPGWHIECSAMSMKYLGETFDIHGGGADLVFPHNENEIAQSEALTGKPFARYWLHNGFVTVDNEKMSKSLGNFRTLGEILGKFSPEAVRLFFLSAHYRSPLDFSGEELEKSEASMRRLAECDKKIASSGFAPARSAPAPGADKYLAEFEEQMDNDFNTPGALAAVFNLARLINSAPEGRDISAEARAFAVMRETLGLPVKLEKPKFAPRVAAGGELEPETAEKLLKMGIHLSDADIEKLLLHREGLRQAKKWEEADRIRDALEKFIVMKDTKEGVSWEKL